MAIPQDGGGGNGTDLGGLIQQFIWLSTLQNAGKLSTDQVTQLQQVTDQLNAADPNAVTDAYNALPQEQQQIVQHLNDQAQQQPGGNITQNKDGTVTLTPDQLAQLVQGQLGNALNQGGGALNINERTASNTVGSQSQKTTEVNYQELPTAEEYLNDWNTSFSAHINGLVQSGAVSSEAADFARNNSGMFYGDYVRAQISDMLKGNPLFKVSGLNPDNKLIGERQGAYSKGEFQQNQQEQYNLEQESSGQNGIGVTALQNVLRSAPGQNTGTAAAARSAAASGGAGSSLTLNEQGTTNQTTQELNSTQEAIVQRNKLGVVANLAPLDFLNQNVSAQRINMLYEGQKGQATRAGQTATGQAQVQEVRRA